MQVTKNITLDLLETGSPVIIKAKQNDRNTRYIAAHLYVGRLDYPVPSGTEIAFRYKKPDGTAGFYDALPNNSPAIIVSGNTVTVELVEQVLTVSGCVHCEINMYNATSEKLTTFTFEIAVEESVLTDAEIISSDYYNVLTAEITKALQAVTDATEQAENAAQSAQDAADSAAMSKDWAAGQPVTYSGTPVSIAYAGAQRIAAITAYGETPQGGTTEAPVALTGVDSVFVGGRNLLPKATLTETISGVTFTPNPDGSISVSGTAANDSYYTFGHHFERALLGQTVCLSGGSMETQLIINERSSGGKFVRNVIINAKTPSASGVLSKQADDNILYGTIYVLKGTTVNTTIYPMLNLGNTAMPYEPYQGSVTPLPIPRALHEVGDVRDICITRVKSVWDKSVQVDINQLKKNPETPYQYYINVESNSVNTEVKPAASTLSYSRTTGVDPFKNGINFWMNGLLEVDDLEHAKAWFTEHPTKVFYQSTSYEGTNGLDVCLTEYMTGFAELDGENVQAAYNPNDGRPYGIFTSRNIIKTTDGVVCSQAKTEAANLNWGYVYASNLPITDIIFGLIGSDITSRTELNAYLTAQKAAGTPVQIAYQLATPEVYATDPFDIDNAAGPLTVMTGGEVEVRMTELVGSRSDVSNNTVSFSEASQDADIQTEETLSTLFGKIKKRFSVITTTFAKLSNLAYGNEVDTGLTWLDGKKIYRKTAIIGPNDYATTTGKDPQERTVYTVSKAGFITNVSMLIRMDVAITYENWFMPLGAKRNGSSDFGGCTYASVTDGTVDWMAEIGLRNPADGPSSFIVICEYTKI